jgi:phospholipase/carboxylesterase
VPTETDTHLLTYNNWTLRVRHAAQNPARLMLLLHGWTGDENSMWVFARNLSPHYWMLAPRGPFAAEIGGYSWRELKPGTWGWPTLTELRPAADALIRLADNLSTSMNVDASTFDVMGFSQGAALTSLLCLLYPKRIRKAAILSGFVPEGTDDLLTRHPLKGKSIFAAHGANDNLVPLERARLSMQKLEQAGAQVNFCEAEVGHKVSADCLRGLQAYFGD